MSTVVWIPYRADDTPEGAWRARIFPHVLAQAESLGFPVMVGDSGDGVFSIARTWNQLAAQSGDWDFAVKWGADLILEDPKTVLTAIAEVIGGPASKGQGPGAPYVFAFDKTITHTGPQTRRWLDHGTLPSRLDGALPVGGVNVISRAVWNRIGGYPEKFVGWGGEDKVVLHAINLVAGPAVHVPGTMHIPWHPRTATLAYHQRRHYNRSLRDQALAITDPGELIAWMHEPGVIDE